MNHIKFVVPGRAIPAVRMTQRSKWNERSSKYLAYKSLVGWEAKAAGAKKIMGDVSANLTFYICQGRRPDLDNLIKSILDSCNMICYDDDRQVTKIQAEIIKSSREEQRVEAVFKPAKGDYHK